MHGLFAARGEEQAQPRFGNVPAIVQTLPISVAKCFSEAVLREGYKTITDGYCVHYFQTVAFRG